MNDVIITCNVQSQMTIIYGFSSVIWIFNLDNSSWPIIEYMWSTYIILNGLTDNKERHSTSYILFFPSLVGVGKMSTCTLWNHRKRDLLFNCHIFLILFLGFFPFLSKIWPYFFVQCSSCPAHLNNWYSLCSRPLKLRY